MAAPRQLRPVEFTRSDPQIDEIEAARMRDKLRSELFGIKPKPQLLGRFMILDRIGAGAMGAVYAAYDPDLDRRVAIKVLQPISGPDGASDARLVREARALAKLDHPNVVTVHEVGTYEGRVFVAMEFVEGSTLTQWLDQPRTIRELLPLFVMAGRGLAAAHAEGLVHRDFKPDNVLVANKSPNRGRVRVVDFGLVRLPGETTVDIDAPPDSEEPLVHTMTGAVLGTPAYMSPEQHRGEPATAASDQFAFCVALLEAMTGQRPFHGNSRPELLDAIEERRITTAKGAAGRIPKRLLRAVLRGLEPNALDRWPDMNALLAALERDPRRQWRLGAALVAVGTATLIATWASAPESDPCQTPREALAQIYNPDVVQTIHDAFVGTPTPAAPQIVAGLRSRLDVYSDAWWQAREEVCEPQDDVAIRKAICLDAELAAFDTLLSILVAPDQEIVRDALALAPDSADLARCSSVVAINVSRPDAEVSGMLARAKAMSTAGRRDESSALTQAALARARKIGNLASEAQALLRQARATIASHRAAEALDLLDQAALLAEQAGDDVTRANCLRARVSALVRVHRLDEASQVAALAEAALQRFPTRPLAWDVELDLLQGEMADARAEYQEALEHYRRGIERTTSGTVAPIVRMILLGRISNTELKRGRFEASLEFEAELRAEIEAEYGSAHPNLATSWVNTGAAAYKLGRRGEAEAALRHALALHEGVAHGPDDPSLSAVLTNLGGILVETNPEEAEDLLRRARRATIAGRGETHPHVLSIDLNLAVLFESQSRLQQAEPHLRDAIERAHATFDEGDARIARLQAFLGSILVEGGRNDEARELLEVALTTLEGDPDTNARYLLRPNCSLARALLDEEPERARTLAQRCLERAETRKQARWQIEAACVLAVAGPSTGASHEQLQAWAKQARDGANDPALPPRTKAWLQRPGYCTAAHSGP